MECARQNYNWIKIDEDKCTGCGLCVEYCPRDVFRMNDENYSCVKYRDDCWYCDVCTFVCVNQVRPKRVSKGGTSVPPSFAFRRLRCQAKRIPRLQSS